MMPSIKTGILLIWIFISVSEANSKTNANPMYSQSTPILHKNGISGVIIGARGVGRNSPTAFVLNGRNKYDMELQKLVHQYKSEQLAARQAGTTVIGGVVTTYIVPATTSASTSTTSSTTTTPPTSSGDSSSVSGILSLLQQLQSTSSNSANDHHHHHHGYQSHPWPQSYGPSNQQQGYSSSNQHGYGSGSGNQQLHVLGYVDNSGASHIMGNNYHDSTQSNAIIKYIQSLPGFNHHHGTLPQSSYNSHTQSYNPTQDHYQYHKGHSGTDHVHGYVDLSAVVQKPHQGYGAPPNKGYGAPPNKGYGAPPNKGYGAPPNKGYGAPPNQGYGAPPNQGYGAPPNKGYGAPSNHGSPHSGTGNVLGSYNYYPISQNVHGLVLPPLFVQNSEHTTNHNQGSYQSPPPHHHHYPQVQNNGSPSIIVTQVVAGPHGLITTTLTAYLSAQVAASTTYIFTSSIPATEAVTTLIAVTHPAGSTSTTNPSVTTIIVTTGTSASSTSTATSTTTTTSTTSVSSTVSITPSTQAITLTQSAIGTGASTIVLTGPITAGRNLPKIVEIEPSSLDIRPFPVQRSHEATFKTILFDDAESTGFEANEVF